MKQVKTKYYTVFNIENYGKNHNLTLQRGELLVIVDETEKYFLVKRAGRGNHVQFLIAKNKIEEI